MILTVDTARSQQMIAHVHALAQAGGGTLKMADLLKLMDFPAPAIADIDAVRGDVVFVCPHAHEGTFTSTGQEISETIPNGLGARIVLRPDIRGKVAVSPAAIVLSDLAGLDVDPPLLPEWLDKAIERIVITPGQVDLQLL